MNSALVSLCVASLSACSLDESVDRDFPNRRASFLFDGLTLEGPVSWFVDVNAAEGKITSDELWISARGVDERGRQHELRGSVHLQGKGARVSDTLLIDEDETGSTGPIGVLEAHAWDPQSGQVTTATFTPIHLEVRLSRTAIDAKLRLHPGRRPTATDPTQDVSLYIAGPLQSTNCSIVRTESVPRGQPARVNLVGGSHALCLVRQGEEL